MLNKNIPYIFVFMSVCHLVCAGPVHAYVGPGAGMGLISSFLALAAVIAMSLFMILLYPIKAMLRKRRNANPDTDITTAPDEPEDTRETDMEPKS